MNAQLNIMVLPGDGIGAEVTAEALRILDWAVSAFDLNLNISESSFGIRLSAAL